MTQEELAEFLFVSKRTVITYEKSDVVPPAKVQLLHSISKIVDTLNEENVDTEEVLRIAESKVEYLKKKSKSDDYKHTEAIPVDFTEMSVMYVPLVNQYAQAGYLNGFGDEEYLDDLPKLPWANDVENRGDYLCFEVKGDSMDDGSYESYLEGDILLCRNVRQDFWMSKLHIKKWDFVIVHQEKGVLVKRIIKHDVEKGIITLHSLNDYYDDFEVKLKNVAKIFNIVDFKRKKNRR